MHSEPVGILSLFRVLVEGGGCEGGFFFRRVHGLAWEGGNSRTWYILGTVGKWLVLVGLVRLVSGISFERAEIFFFFG